MVVGANKDIYIVGYCEVLGNANASINLLPSGIMVNNKYIGINKGQLSIYGTFTNKDSAQIDVAGQVNVYSGGTISNTDTFVNNGSAVFETDSTFSNSGTVSGVNAETIPVLVVSSNVSVACGAIYSGISFSGTATLTALGNLTSTTLSMTNGTLILGDTGTAAKGWNFIPNPYSSNLNITTLLSSGNFTPTYKAVHVYVYINDQYQVYSNSGVTIVNYTNTGTDGTIKNLSPYVGFWVKSGVDQTVTLINSERTTSMTNVATLLKTSMDLLRLDVFDADNKWDQCVIYPQEGATIQVDVYSISGQLVESKTIERNGIQSMPLSSLQTSGVYIVRAQAGAESQQIKVVR